MKQNRTKKSMKAAIKLLMFCMFSNNNRHPVPKSYTSLHYTCRHFTSSHLNFTQLHFTTLSFGLTPFKFPTALFHLTTLHFTSLLFTALLDDYYYYYYYYYYCDAHFVMFEVCQKQNSVCWHAISYKIKHKIVSTKQKNRCYVINAVSGAVSKARMCYAVHDTHIDQLRVTTYFLLYPKPIYKFYHIIYPLRLVQTRNFTDKCRSLLVCFHPFL